MIRGSQLGESHGGLYRVDLQHGTAELALDWNTTAIDVSGRGGDRGLRGIAFYGEAVLVAANDSLLMFDQDFALLDAFTNPFLAHCHEICVVGQLAFLTATGFDSVLTFDLGTKRFVAGWHLGAAGGALALRKFDPNAAGPAPGHRFHLNSVTASPTGMWFSGLHTPGLLYTDGVGLQLAAPLPQGTHNARLHDDGVLYNDTAADRVCHQRSGVTRSWPVPAFEPHEIVGLQRFGSAVARPGFARGLCVLDGGLIAAGSSPSTVAVHDLRDGGRGLMQNLSMDVRNAVHGLAVWPYA